MDLRKSLLNPREYQIKAIQAAEKAIIEGRQTVLLAMATGTGKQNRTRHELTLFENGMFPPNFIFGESYCIGRTDIRCF